MFVCAGGGGSATPKPAIPSLWPQGEEDGGSFSFLETKKEGKKKKKGGVNKRKGLIVFLLASCKRSQAVVLCCLALKYLEDWNILYLFDFLISFIYFCVKSLSVSVCIGCLLGVCKHRGGVRGSPYCGLSTSP